MAQTQVLNDIGKVNISAEVAQVAIKLGWLVNAMKANDDSPAAEILDGITRQLDNLVEPIAELQGVRS